MRQYMYIRGGLLNGLKLQAQLGVNPFKMGMAGGTDVHNSLTSIEENNFFGKHVDQEPRPDRWSGRVQEGTRFHPLQLAIHRRRLYGSLGHRKHTHGAVGCDEAQGGLRDLGLAHYAEVLRRL